MPGVFDCASDIVTDPRVWLRNEVAPRHGAALHEQPKFARGKIVAPLRGGLWSISHARQTLRRIARWCVNLQLQRVKRILGLLSVPRVAGGHEKQSCIAEALAGKS